jgi:polyisoprenoid-binding protein YceI
MMKKNKIQIVKNLKTFSVLALGLLSAQFASAADAPAASVPLKCEGGSVGFLATGQPSALKIHGTSTGAPTASLKLEGSQLKGDISFDLEKLDTGIELRTHHMKEKYLNVKDFPQAKLSLIDAPVDTGFAGSLSNGGEKAFKGKLSLHGKEHEVNGTYTAAAGVIKAKFPLTLADYGIDVPKYLGITVANTVDVNVDLPVKK